MLYKDKHRIMSEQKYYNFVLNEYNPSNYESQELEDSRFKKGTYYSHICKTRCFLIYREIANNLHVKNKVIDFGFFPGTILRQLKILFNDDILCYGIGQKVDAKFEKYTESFVEETVLAEFDPFYQENKDTKISVPYNDQTFDAVIATEILEHLISPLDMISEGARILKKGGIFIMTTPNVSHIGAIFKLLKGKSNYERLDRSPMYLQKDNWRGHIRFYDKSELIVLYHRYGLKLLKHQYYLERGWDHALWPFIKRLVINCVDKLIPPYRENHFAVFTKK
ncbi:methyltransferase domain-containing protein [Acidobacteriota bacterium]